MVDFNNDNTIGTPAVDIVRVLILEKRTNVIEALETINKRDSTDNYDNSLLKSRMQSLFWEMQGMLERKKNHKDHKESIQEINHVLFSKKPTLEELMKVFGILNLYLDDIRLTRIDNNTQYDRRRVENVNTRSHI